MARLSERPRTFFRVSPDLPKPECYSIRQGDLEGRLNAEFYRAEFRDLIAQLKRTFPNIRCLRDYAEIVCGPFGSEITVKDYVKEGVPLLRISNITEEGTLDLSDVVFISPPKAAALASTQVTAGDLVISQRGTLGMPAVVSDEFPVFNISANLIAIKRLSDLSARYVQLFLASSVGERQIARLKSGQVHPKITTDDLAAVLIPELANQDKAVHSMEEARAARQLRITEAKSVMAQLDEILLHALHLRVPERAERKCFAVKVKDAQEYMRLNSDYFNPERTLAVRTIQNAPIGVGRRLGDIVEFVRHDIKAPCENYVGLANVESQTGELVDADEEVFGTCFKFKTNDVLFARLRPYLNKVYRAEMDGCCSPEFQVLRCKELDSLKPEYLAAVLRSALILAQTRHMMTGNTHPRLTYEDVVNLVIPVPKADLQNQIATALRRNREHARRLHTEAETEWLSAKRAFEDQLLR